MTAITARKFLIHKYSYIDRRIFGGFNGRGGQFGGYYLTERGAENPCRAHPRVLTTDTSLIRFARANPERIESIRDDEFAVKINRAFSVNQCEPEMP